uniref:Uncharacterized protein n=1 Tax=Anguilla anguilla TaxID=7936 RepID=A0A0E9XS33_ANGAN
MYKMDGESPTPFPPMSQTTLQLKGHPLPNWSIKGKQFSFVAKLLKVNSSYICIKGII